MLNASRALPTTRTARALEVLGSLAASRRTAYTHAHESLRSGILTGRVPAGTRLVQKEIAQLLNVSTTPVREALRDLVSEGLVRVDAHRGAVVTGLDHTDVLDACEILRLLEPEAVRRSAVHATDREVAAARGLQHELEQTPQSVEWVWFEARFHDMVAGFARSPRLESLSRSARSAVFRHLATVATHHYSCARQHNDLHRRLLDSLGAKRSDEAAELVSAHLNAIMSCALDRPHHASTELAGSSR